MNKRKISISAALLLSLAALSSDAMAYSHKYTHAKHAYAKSEANVADSIAVPATGKLEVAFSPNESSERLVIKVIDSATTELLVLSYSFTSAPVTEALIRAEHRGVKVSLVADYKENVTEDRSHKARAALSALKNAGVDVRTIRVYPIHHDKVIIADRETLELGSFNYSAAAAHKNSENVLVNWNNPELAGVYVKHFTRNYNQSSEYVGQY